MKINMMIGLMILGVLVVSGCTKEEFPLLKEGDFKVVSARFSTSSQWMSEEPVDNFVISVNFNPSDTELLPQNMRYSPIECVFIADGKLLYKKEKTGEGSFTFSGAVKLEGPGIRDYSTETRGGILANFKKTSNHEVGLCCPVGTNDLDRAIDNGDYICDTIYLSKSE